MHGWGVFFFLLFLLLVFGAVGWIAYTQIRARRQGLPPPSWQSYIPFMHSSAISTTNYPTPRSSNPLEWIKDQLAKLSNKRTARGAYEETGSGTEGYLAPNSNSAGRRGRGGVEDDAWDTRVGGGIEDPYDRESGPYYNEEAELGLAPTPGLVNEPYAGASDYIGTGGGGERGRTQNRPSSTQNPFADENAMSLRAVSPRPVEAGVTSGGAGHVKGQSSLGSGGAGESPTERRSMFSERL